VPTIVMLVLQKAIHSCSCVLFSWPDWLIEQNRFVPTFPTGKGRSGRRRLYQFQHDTEKLCTPLDRSGWRGPQLENEKGNEPHWRF